MFVCYQAVGTLGRAIEDGAQKVKIFGDEIGIAAEIHKIEGFSGHADRDGLLDWLSGFTRKPRKVFMVHGEKDSARDFAKTVTQRLGIETVVPVMGETIDIGLTKVISTGIKDLHKAASATDAPDVSELTVKVMQVKVRFMEAMDSIYKSVVSGRLEPDEAGRIIDEVQRILDEERAS